MKLIAFLIEYLTLLIRLLKMLLADQTRAEKSLLTLQTLRRVTGHANLDLK